MTTALDLVTDAAYAAKVLGQDQTLSSGDGNLILRRLGRMLDSWSTEDQMIFSNDEQLFTMVPGQQAYTTAVLSGGRPVGIDSMRLSLGQVDYTVDQIDQLKWNSIPVKSITGIPIQMYYDGAMPAASMFFYPIPFAAFTVHIYCQRLLVPGTLTTTSVLTLPPGYEAAIVANLAVDIWGSFKTGDPTKSMLMEANQTKAVIKRNNFKPMEMETPFSDSGDISNAFPFPFW